MPKTEFTPRDELVCGKLDKARDYAVQFESVELVDLLDDIRHDCERMEQKLISRKDEVARYAAVVKATRGLNEAVKKLPANDGRICRLIPIITRVDDALSDLGEVKGE